MSESQGGEYQGILAGATDAEHIQLILTGACSQYWDGSGSFDAAVALAIFNELEVETVTEAIGASELRQLTWLGRVLSQFFNRFEGRPCPGLDQLRAAVSGELKRKLTCAADPLELAFAINLECFPHPGGKGKINLDGARKLFDEAVADDFMSVMRRGDRATHDYLSTTLDSIAGAFLPDHCAGLEQIRTALSNVQAQSLAEAQERLPEALDAEALLDCIVTNCLVSRRQTGVDPKAARQLFASLDVNQIRHTLQQSSGPSLSKLHRVLHTISRALQPPCEEVEILLAATNQQLDLWLGIVREELDEPFDVDVIVEVIAISCAEYSDGSGHVTERTLRLLFKDFRADRFTQVLKNAGVPDCQKLRRIFKQLRHGLRQQTPHRCHGLDDAVRATGAAIALAMRDMPETIHTVEELSDAICSVCSEFDDGGGQIDATATRSLFEHCTVQQFADILAEANSASLKVLARSLQKIALKLGYPRCEGLEALRRAIAD